VAQATVEEDKDETKGNEDKEKAKERRKTKERKFVAEEKAGDAYNAMDVDDSREDSDTMSMGSHTTSITRKAFEVVVSFSNCLPCYANNITIGK
jgi:hypothetical protein